MDLSKSATTTKIEPKPHRVFGRNERSTVATPEPKTTAIHPASRVANLEEIVELLANRVAKLEAWARGYANPLLYRGLSNGERMTIDKGTPYNPPSGRDVPDLKLKDL